MLIWFVTNVTPLHLQVLLKSYLEGGQTFVFPIGVPSETLASKTNRALLHTRYHVKYQCKVTTTGRILYTTYPERTLSQQHFFAMQIAVNCVWRLCEKKRGKSGAAQIRLNANRDK